MCRNNVATGATGTAIGTGSANTTAIISAQGATETSYAAGLAGAYTGGGYTDWFLPSKDELNKMYLNKATINTTAAANSGSDFVSDYYWSSTEGDSSNAWLQYFSNGDQANYNKGLTPNVRAVRAF
ncbi:Lcl C-terminal domain-containing protein [Polaribacter sp.]|uniref:Lcl C-terminal domain-containing protein n=1 Tax=Polaribacter sp. TaxID=1920175 RepID=UPI00404831A5